MPDAISNTSPLFYLHRIGALKWLPKLFNSIWIPSAVRDELEDGLKRGYEVPILGDFLWLEIVNPKSTPSEWLALDLGPGELATMSLALENPKRIVLLDDMLARRTAQAAGLTVWGTLKILLEAKGKGLAKTIKSYVNRLQESGMWISDDIIQRILTLANE